MNFNSTDSRAFLSGTLFNMYEVVRVSGISCLRFACLLAPRNTKGKVKLTVSRVLNGKVFITHSLESQYSIAT